LASQAMSDRCCPNLSLTKKLTLSPPLYPSINQCTNTPCVWSNRLYLHMFLDESGLKHLLILVFYYILEKSMCTFTWMDILEPKQSSVLTVEKGSAVGKLGESLITGIRYLLMYLFYWKYSFSYYYFSNSDPVAY
jgi:hypothetical protein